jgi:hypothetical protein
MSQILWRSARKQTNKEYKKKKRYCKKKKEKKERNE